MLKFVQQLFEESILQSPASHKCTDRERRFERNHVSKALKEYCFLICRFEHARKAHGKVACYQRGRIFFFVSETAKVDKGIL